VTGGAPRSFVFSADGRTMRLASGPGDPFAGPFAGRGPGAEATLRRLLHGDAVLAQRLVRWFNTSGVVAVAHSRTEVVAAVLGGLRRGRYCLISDPPERSSDRFSHDSNWFGPQFVGPAVPVAEIEDELSVIITRCDPRLLDGPLTFEYLLRLRGRPARLEIRSERFPGGLLYARDLSPEEASDGAHGGEWDGVVATPGPLQGERARPSHGPATVHIIHDFVHRDVAAFTIAGPPLSIVVPDLIRFDRDSALAVPGPWTTEGAHPLAALVQALVGLVHRPDHQLLIAGHGDASGNAGHNQSLSARRCDALRALIEGDADAWIEHARAQGSLRDVLAYTEYLGARRAWSCARGLDVDSIGVQADTQTRESVGAFQGDYNSRFQAELAVDGICGGQTLGAMFEVLHDELERWLAKFGCKLGELPRERIAYRGYGETLAGRHASLDVRQAHRRGPGADRVVDLILIPDSEQGVAPISPETLYDDPSLRWATLGVPEEPDEWGTGPFTVVTDLTPDEPVDSEIYKLFATDDPSFNVAFVVPEEASEDAGELVLRYQALPTHLRYTLVVISENGTHSTIFKDVPYGRLHEPPESH